MSKRKSQPVSPALQLLLAAVCYQALTQEKAGKLTAWALASNICAALATNNPGFDRAAFLTQCGFPSRRIDQ